MLIGTKTEALDYSCTFQLSRTAGPLGNIDLRNIKSYLIEPKTYTNRFEPFPKKYNSKTIFYSEGIQHGVQFIVLVGRAIKVSPLE
jgi:hypothetical protein